MDSNQRIWAAAKFKYEEAEFFLLQLKSYEKEPRTFLFFLSAFITSARAVTFHLQKNLSHINKTKTYDELRDKMLSDGLCKFFVSSRNELEKEGYPKLSLLLLKGLIKESENTIWTAYAGGAIDPFEENYSFHRIHKMIDDGWELTNKFSGVGENYEIKFLWKFNEEYNVISSSETYLNLLWRFLIRLRQEIG